MKNRSSSDFKIKFKSNPKMKFSFEDKPMILHLLHLVQQVHDWYRVLNILIINYLSLFLSFIVNNIFFLNLTFFLVNILQCGQDHKLFSTKLFMCVQGRCQFRQTGPFYKTRHVAGHLIMPSIHKKTEKVLDTDNIFIKTHSIFLEQQCIFSKLLTYYYKSNNPSLSVAENMFIIFVNAFPKIQ